MLAPRPPPPLVPSLTAEAVLEANEAYTRFLVKWVGRPKALASWVPRRKVEPSLLSRFLEEQMAVFNRTIEPLLAQADASGGVALCVPAADAEECASYLHAHWSDGRLALAATGKVATGYSSYGKTLSPHDSQKQREHTLLLTNTLLPAVRLVVPGFHAIEEFLTIWLEATYGTVVELFYAHGLRQGPATLSSTGFAIHQDTEDYDFIEYTVVVKLTPNAPGEPPSAMRVVGATRHFHYGPERGASGSFRARVHHASVAPESGAGEHLKIAYFFRASAKGERRAKRAYATYGSAVVEGAADDDDGLAQRRRRVTQDLNSFTFEAQAMLPQLEA